MLHCIVILCDTLSELLPVQGRKLRGEIPKKGQLQN